MGALRNQVGKGGGFPPPPHVRLSKYLIFAYFPTSPLFTLSPTPLFLGGEERLLCPNPGTLNTPLIMYLYCFSMLSPNNIIRIDDLTQEVKTKKR